MPQALADFNSGQDASSTPKRRKTEFTKKNIKKKKPTTNSLQLYFLDFELYPCLVLELFGLSKIYTKQHADRDWYNGN